MTWLLVEDDSDIRNVVAVMMSVWGEKPLPFPDGGAAWAWLDTVANGTYTGELPELALMDIRMPGYTGDKVAARIRQTPSLKDIPIILMTAFSLTDVEIKDMMDQAGVDHLINKPLPDMEQFRLALYRVRDEKKARLVARQQAAENAAPPVPASATPTPAAPVAPAPVPSAPVAPVPSTPAASNTPPVNPAQPVSATPAVPAPSTPAAPTPITPAVPTAPSAPAAPSTPATPQQSAQPVQPTPPAQPNAATEPAQPVPQNTPTPANATPSEKKE